MAASTGGGDIEESSNSNNDSLNTSSKPPQLNIVEETSVNGSATCSIPIRQTSSNLLRPSVFSTGNSVGSVSSSTFGASPSPINFGHTSQTNPFANSSLSSPFKLRPSVFGSVDKDPVVKRPVILRASQLEPVVDSSISSSTSTISNSKSFVLSPAKLNNPLMKSAVDVQEGDNGSISSTSEEKEETSVSVASEKEQNVEGVKVSFVPLASSGAESSSHTPTPASNITSVPSFVFGQNLLERVEVAADAERNSVETCEASSSKASNCQGESSKTNGTTPEMLFSSVLKQELPEKLTEVGKEDERKRKSLSEAAREYEESRASKRKYEEVTVKTGEEEEINILQINCKLFAFNKEKSTWVERGRGTLRVNDLSQDNRTQSRVVMRVSGSLRVVLNTKIWAEMAVDRPSEKSVRLTAMDNSAEIKVFLVMAGVKEIDQLFRALEWRVNNQKKLANSEKSGDTDGS